MIRIRVALFDNHADAQVFRDRLVRAGVPAECHKEPPLGRLWFVSTKMAGVRLEVPAQDRERSTRLLHKWHSEQGDLGSAVRCPECGSFCVDYPQFTQKSTFTNLAIGLIAGLRLIERQYYCEDCHCLWPKPGKRRHRVRSHVAPNYFLEGLRNDSPQESSESQTGSAVTGFNREGRHGKTPLHRWSAKGRFHPSKRWRKTLGIALLLSGASLFDEGFAHLVASEAQPSSTNTSSVELPEKGGPQHASSVQEQTSANLAAPTYLRDVLPILMGKCARCHNDRTPVLDNWLDYRRASAKRMEIKRRVCDSWTGAYFKQPMPTGNSPESQVMTEEERTTIRRWAQSGAALGVRPAFGTTQSKADRIELGRRLFTSICAACHQPSGYGIPGRFPPLAGSDFLNSDKDRAIKVLVNGLQGEVVVNGQTFNNTMPKFPLSDEDIACALTYVYSSFGNSGQDVTPAEVNSARAEKEDLNTFGKNHGARAPEEKSPFE